MLSTGKQNIDAYEIHVHKGKGLDSKNKYTVCLDLSSTFQFNTSDPFHKSMEVFL